MTETFINLMEQYKQEILRLKELLREKEGNLLDLQKKSTFSSQLYVNYNKKVFDQLKSMEERKMNSSLLDLQINERNQARQKEVYYKELETKARLEDLKRQKEEDLANEYNIRSRARSYKEDLDTQKYLKSHILAEETQTFKAEIPRPVEVPIQSVSPNPLSAVTRTYFTKNQPKTLFFNPITGDLNDSSKYLQGKFPLHRQSGSNFLPYLKDSHRPSPDFSGLKAFQQPKYTKSHPKFVPSFPVTGGSYQYGERSLKNIGLAR